MTKKFLNLLKISCCVIFIHLNIQYASAIGLNTNPLRMEDILKKDSIPQPHLLKDSVAVALSKNQTSPDSVKTDSTLVHPVLNDSMCKPDSGIHLAKRQFKRTIKSKDTIRHWGFEGHFLLNFSQLYFENWSLGGENAIAGNTLEDFLLTYKSNKATWESTLKFASGLVKQNGNKLRKTDDRIEITSKYGRRINGKFNYSVFGSIQTQLFPGYKEENDPDKISDFFAPGYFFTSVGLDYRPTPKISFYCSPVGGKVSLVNSNFIIHYDQQGRGAFGVLPGHHALYELGGSFVFTAKGNILKNLYSQIQMNGFSSYQKSLNQMVWNGEFLLSMKINKFISANIKANLIYDPEVSLKPQLKEFFGLGFSYNL